MTKEEIIARLQGVFDNLLIEPIGLTEELSAKDVPEWDSLLHISLVVAVEKAFQIRFSLGEVEATKNIGEFADIIHRRVAKP